MSALGAAMHKLAHLCFGIVHSGKLYDPAFTPKSAEVLEAAGTKWNFLYFKSGLVGGHCIGADPYCLTYQAEKFGHHPEVIPAGCRINDGMGKYIAEQTVNEMGSVAKGRRHCPGSRASRIPRHAD